MLQRHVALAVSLVFAAVLESPELALADSAPLTKEQLASRLGELIEKSGVGSNMGAVVAEVGSGQRLYTLSPETPRNPASNMKLVTAATALTELGPQHRLRTTLAGSIGAEGQVERIVLRGEGDPSLRFEDLLGMARRAADLGVRTVEEIVVDGSYFDEQTLPPAFEQQPKEVAAFRAAVAAVSVDRNAYELRVAPGPAVGAPANLILRCPDHFAVDATLVTTASGAASIVAEHKQRGDELALRVRGSVPAKTRGIGYERRIESPLPYAGHCLAAALRAADVSGPLRVRVSRLESSPPVLVTHESEALGLLLARVGKNSDNFYAEMLLKVVGAESTDRPGSSAQGLGRAQALLAAAGVAPADATLVNGSGLFKGGAISAQALVRVLIASYRNPALQAEYVSQLATAGTDGTLATRLVDLKAARIVRAKTGTLDDVVALSGYVLGPDPSRTLAFSFLVNGVSGKQWMARDLVDSLVRALVSYLYP